MLVTDPYGPWQKLHDLCTFKKGNPSFLRDNFQNQFFYFVVVLPKHQLRHFSH